MYLNWFSSRIAELTAPLHEFTKKNSRFKWGQTRQATMDKIKEEIRTAQVIYYDPDPSTTTILQYDARQEGLGAWLGQLGSSSTERIVAMASSSLTTAESRYSNIERECLAVMYWAKEIRVLLNGTTHCRRDRPFSTGTNILEHCWGTGEVTEAAAAMSQIWRRSQVQAWRVYTCCW